MTEAKVDREQACVVQEIYPRLMQRYIDRFRARGRGGRPSLGGWSTVLSNAWLLQAEQQHERQDG
jgi:hypothetical protein